METEFLVIYCTCPDRSVADLIATAVIEKRLAACVNVMPDITSVYRWQGQVRRDAELLLIIKTHYSMYATLEARIRELHPYEVPEIIALPIVQGARSYLDWITNSVGQAGTGS